MLKIYAQAIIFIGLITVITLSASTPPPVMNDPYTGLYYVHGTKIVKFYKCPFFGLCGSDDGPFHDTTRIASIVAVKWMEDKTDTLHFFGLPGADEGEIKLYYGNNQISDKAGDISLYDTFNRYRIYGSLSGNSFEILYNNAHNFYEATGNIIQDKIELQAQYNVRTTTVEYFLTGEKVFKTD